MIKVSVIVPIYNAEKYLRECLDSIVNQTLKEIEIILIDDGSTDGSAEICQEYLHDSRVSYYRKENEGLAAARDDGMQRATGEYIGFVDSDDWLEPDMYEKMYQAGKSIDADIVYCDYKREKKVKNKDFFLCSGGVSENVDDYINEILSGDCSWFLWNKIFKREIAQRDYSNVCQLHICYSEDALRTCCMLKNCRVAVGVKEYLYHYRARPDSMVHRYMFSVQNRKNILEAIAKLDQMFVEDKYRKAMDDCCRYALYIALSIPGITATEWRSFCPQARNGILRDKRLLGISKIVFICACLSFTLTYFFYQIFWKIRSSIISKKII